MQRDLPFWRFARTVTAIAAASSLVAGCSMAGLPNFKMTPRPAATAQLTGVAPRPQMRPVAEEAFVPFAFTEAPKSAGGSVDGLIGKYAATYDVPESLIRRVVQRESGYNPKARNGPYLGLMQIRHETARSMGYKGPASGLLDAETNLKYAVKYLRGAYVVAGYNSDRAMRLYARGYYYDAKRAGLLDEAGLN
jgi:soluble lytic murein transglycosylase-like protein